MAKVLVSLKIFPSDIDVNLEILKEEIKKNLPCYASIYGFEDQPIAFGLVALLAHILIPEDREGGLEEVESSLRENKKISDFQTVTVRRV